MEYQEGPDLPRKTEMEKLTEEIEDMEYEEKISLSRNRKMAISLTYVANILALTFFIFWSELAKEEGVKEFLLVFSIIPLIALFYLFMVFRCYNFKQENLQKHLENNFCALLALFVILTMLSIIKV